MTETPNGETEATGGPSALSAGLEMRYPPEALELLRKMADVAEKSALVTRREIAPDDAVWLNIYCAVANCFNSEKRNAVDWADEGLREFHKRFSR
jgi:hypothetical protein